MAQCYLLYKEHLNVKYGKYTHDLPSVLLPFGRNRTTNTTMMTMMMKTRRATPPTTPPTIGPIEAVDTYSAMGGGMGRRRERRDVRMEGMGK